MRLLIDANILLDVLQNRKPYVQEASMIWKLCEESGTRLAAMAGTGDWQEGRRFSSSAAESEVASWAQSAAE